MRLVIGSHTVGSYQCNLFHLSILNYWMNFLQVLFPRWTLGYHVCTIVVLLFFMELSVILCNFSPIIKKSVKPLTIHHSLLVTEAPEDLVSIDFKVNGCALYLRFVQRGLLNTFLTFLKLERSLLNWKHIWVTNHLIQVCWPQCYFCF